MANYVSAPQSNSEVLVLQEKWDENIKRHPIAFTILLLMFVVAPLVCSFFVKENRELFFVVIAVGFLFFLLVNIVSIIKFFSPKCYKVSVADGRIKILKNDKEVLNVKGGQITFLKFVNHPMSKNEVTGLRVQYTDENSKTRYFNMNLSFIPKENCKELVNRVATFYVNNVNQANQTDGENWKTNLIISLILTIVLGFLAANDHGEDGRIVVALCFGVIWMLVSLYKLLKKK